VLFVRIEKLKRFWRGEAQEVWRPKHIFHYIQWKDIKPEFVIDISEFLDKKIASCMAYKTQFYDPTSKEPETPITTKDFLRA
jgi:LmbE family N-acetylglucosaminyl deacetylase